MDNKKLLLLSGTLPVFEILTGLIHGTLSASGGQAGYDLLLHFYDAAACVFILNVQFGLLTNRTLQLELAVAEQMLREARRQYVSSRENIDIINQKCHDLKHQIRSLRKAPRQVDSQVLREIEQAVEIYDCQAETGSDPLDVILTEKSLICEKEGISLTCMAQGEKISFMAPSDIYALFGNALDNAITAVLELAEREKRTISLHVLGKGRMVSIHVENPFSGTLVYREDGGMETTKADKDYHGFGMRSMQMIAEKYGGFLTQSVQGDVFHLNIVLPVPRRESAQGWNGR